MSEYGVVTEFGHGVAPAPVLVDAWSVRGGI